MTSPFVQTLLEGALAPVLIRQGKRVRRETPRLPEPEGPREGGAEARLRLLVVGDSSAAGVGAARWDEALTARLVEALGGPDCVGWRLVARTGWTTAQALRALEPVEGPFDLAVTALGVNDVTARTPMARARDLHRRLLEELTARLGARHVVVSALPPLRSFPALPWPLRAVLGRRADLHDAALEEVERDVLAVRRVRPIGDEPEAAMASDGFHPGPSAYAVWTRRILDRLPPELLQTHRLCSNR